MKMFRNISVIILAIALSTLVPLAAAGIAALVVLAVTPTIFGVLIIGTAATLLFKNVFIGVTIALLIGFVLYTARKKQKVEHVV